MEIGFIFCATIDFVIFFGLLTLIFTHKDGVIRLSLLRNLLVIFGVALVGLAYFFIPDDSIRYDLFEHYQVIDEMRGMPFWFAIESCVESGSYYLYAVYCYIISRFSSSQAFPVVPIIIDYVCFLYIFLDRFYVRGSNDDRVSAFSASFTFVFWFSTFGLKLAITGVRCVTSCAVASLGVYLYCKNKKFLLPLLLFVTSLFIHSFSLVLIFVMCVSRIRAKSAVLAMMVAFNCLGLALFNQIGSLLSIRYFSFLTSKVIRYWLLFTPAAIAERSGKMFLLFYFSIVLFVVVLFFYMKKYMTVNRVLSQMDNRICNYVFALLCFSVGMCFNYLFIERTLYLISYAFLMLLPVRTSRTWQNAIWLYGILFLSLFIFLNNDVISFIINYL